MSQRASTCAQQGNDEMELANSFDIENSSSFALNEDALSNAPNSLLPATSGLGLSCLQFEGLDSGSSYVAFPWNAQPWVAFRPENSVCTVWSGVDKGNSGAS
jgi:hypothetical protein